MKEWEGGGGGGGGLLVEVAPPPPPPPAGRGRSSKLWRVSDLVVVTSLPRELQ